MSDPSSYARRPGAGGPAPAPGHRIQAPGDRTEASGNRTQARGDPTQARVDRTERPSDQEASHGWGAWLLPLMTRLHFYVGLFIGPFLLVAALSGIVYAMTPQLEDMVYRHALYTDSTGSIRPLVDQIVAANAAIDEGMTLQAVRPAPMPGTTTRVMYTSPALGPSESIAVFVDPVTTEVRGVLDVYGTAGVLPLRSWLDRFHRGLLLGDVGRLYSELAASWLWLLAIGGLTLWWFRRRRERVAASAGQGGAPVGRLRGQRIRRWHGTLGAWAFLGILFFSVTGLTWSNYAGTNIGVLRAHYGWGTPSVSTALPARGEHPARAEHGYHGDHAEHADGQHADHADHAQHADGQYADHADHAQHADGQYADHAEHAEHRAGAAPAGDSSVHPTMFDAVLAAARAAHIDAGKVEIRPPRAVDTAWTVTEVDRSWPTQVDAVAIDPRDYSVLDRTEFDTFPLAAKLTRWGIDAHMGTLFGLPNQLLLVAAATCLTVMVSWGYMMWWRRRPTRDMAGVPRQGIIALSRKAPWPALLSIVLVALAVGWFLPVMGASLVAFLLADFVLQWRASRHRGRFRS